MFVVVTTLYFDAGAIMPTTVVKNAWWTTWLTTVRNVQSLEGGGVGEEALEQGQEVDPPVTMSGSFLESY